MSERTVRPSIPRSPPRPPQRQPAHLGRNPHAPHRHRALLGGNYLGRNWLDAAVGILGAVLISHWAYGLVRDTSTVLLDRERGDPVAAAIRGRIAIHEELVPFNLEIARWVAGDLNRGSVRD